MPVSAHDVARELRQRLSDPGAVKVHKLLYYCQGWHLARHGEPMFREMVEAWANGPVVAELWRDEKHPGRAEPRAQQLDEAMDETLSFVIERYGALSGKDLIQLTHTERPWQVVSERDDPWDDQVIDRSTMREFFSSVDDVYSFAPFSVTDGRRAILDEAKARAVR